jgi:hypothetical protein
MFLYAKMHDSSNEYIMAILKVHSGESLVSFTFTIFFCSIIRYLFNFFYTWLDAIFHNDFENEFKIEEKVVKNARAE